MKPNNLSIFILLFVSLHCYSQKIYTLNVSINQPKSISVSIGNDTMICPTTEAQLVAKTLYGNGGFSYKWSPFSSLLNETGVTNVATPSNNTNYFVTVTDAQNCTASDTILVSIYKPFAEQIGVVTYADDGIGVVIAWERTLGKGTEFYEVLRGTGETGTFTSIGTLPFDAEQSFIIDNDANVQTKSFSYKLITIDSTCSLEAVSEVHSTVHVINNVNTSTGKANLIWSKYKGLEIATYRIKRGTSINNLVQIDSIAGDQPLQFEDQIPYKYGTIYRIEMKLPDTVETRKSMLKAQSGPFSLAMSNIAEAQNNISIQSVSENNIAIYPTEATNKITVAFNSEIENAIISLISANGNVVYATTSSNSQIEIPVAKFATGAYVVKVEVGGKVISTPVVVK